MSKSKEALLIIDYTYDFIDDHGALTCGKAGQDCEDTIIKLANEFVVNDNYVILPTDCHKLNDPFHPESKLFPPHNIEGTSGRDFYGKLKIWYEENSTKNNVWAMPKTRYSSFVGTNLDLDLRMRGVETVHLVGTCTDICVLQTAIYAYNLGYKIVVHQDGVAGTSPENHQFALANMKNNLGATII
ncbi:cysteine hydrolase [Lactobacillus sp. ESL0791]|uniref:cysteine hydrolase family protein n=1 Tax=Lactobacillus sp. ESL0791 TaxID=2983234 RepID=UPI0023F70645|nr:isochorismatase family cysteine hydrolase [Lactobacillus sp. ESL0791]MDF7638998.1 cysteine hydrolase [Lactobacillus sp. ESL0791]